MLYNDPLTVPVSDTAYAIMKAVGVLLILGLIYFLVRMFKVAFKGTSTYRDDTTEAVFNEIHATVLKMNCTVKAIGARIPKAEKIFYITFLTDDGRKVTYSVDEEAYLSIEENQKGTLATMDGEFYGFSPD